MVQGLKRGTAWSTNAINITKLDAILFESLKTIKLVDLYLIGFVLFQSFSCICSQIHIIEENEHSRGALRDAYVKHRKVVVEWMINVCQYFNLHPTTTHGAIAYLDRLQPNERFTRHEWQMVRTAKFLNLINVRVRPFSYVFCFSCTYPGCDCVHSNFL